MYLKKAFLSNNLLPRRLAFYLSLSILFSLLNLLNDLEKESVGEALREQILFLPLSFCFVIGVYCFQQRLTLQCAWFKSMGKKIGLRDFQLWALIMLPISLALGIGFRILSLYLNNDDASTAIFDMLFWAISIAIFVVAIFVYLLEGYLELEIAKKQFQLQMMEAENEKTLAQYQALKKQLNPHFLFNSFNTLINLIHSSPHKAEQFVYELSNIYRYNLDQGEELVVTLKKEIWLIKAYLELKKIRFGESINFSCQVEEEAMHLLLPPMTLTLLVENAVKHNYFDDAHPLMIEIKTDKKTIWVRNNHRQRHALREAVSLGIGQKNLISQYEILEASIPEFYVENGFYIAKIPLIEPEL